jgi:hypothetical protein
LTGSLEASLSRLIGSTGSLEASLPRLIGSAGELEASTSPLEPIASPRIAAPG